MGKPEKGQFLPKNPQKYGGRNLANIIYRSGWEKNLMMTLDAHPSVLFWMSESISIPYKNPFTGRWTMYIPDFFVRYETRNREVINEILEVKPSEEVPGFKGKVSKLKEGRQIVNAAKWQAALDFCRARGWKFRVCTEKEMFGFRKPT